MEISEVALIRMKEILGIIALGQERKEFFKRFLELPHGIPDAYTFNRVFSRVEPAQRFEALQNWYGENGKSGGRLLNNVSSMNYGILKNPNHEGAKGSQRKKKRAVFNDFFLILIRLLRLGGEILGSVELALNKRTWVQTPRTPLYAS